MKIKISYCDREPRILDVTDRDPIAPALLIFAAVQGALAVSDGEELNPEDISVELIDETGSTLFYRTADSLEAWGLPEILRNIPHTKPQGGK